MEARQGRVSATTLRPKASFSTMDTSPLISPHSLSVSSQPLRGVVGGGGGVSMGMGIGVGGSSGFASHVRTTSEGLVNAGDYDGEEWGLGSDGEDTEWNHNEAYGHDHFDDVDRGRIHGVGDSGATGEMMMSGGGSLGGDGMVSGDGRGYVGNSDISFANEGFGMAHQQSHQQQYQQQSMSHTHASHSSSSMSSQHVKASSYGKDVNQTQMQPGVDTIPTIPFAPL